MLNAADTARLHDLAAKPARTPAETAELQALQKKSAENALTNPKATAVVDPAADKPAANEAVEKAAEQDQKDQDRLSELRKKITPAELEELRHLEVLEKNRLNGPPVVGLTAQEQARLDELNALPRRNAKDLEELKVLMRKNGGSIPE